MDPKVFENKLVGRFDQFFVLETFGQVKCKV